MPPARPGSGVYRVFGTPYSVTLHQLAVVMHLRRLPTKLYCRDFLSTCFFSMYHKSFGLFSCLTPHRGEVFYTQNSLIDHLEEHVPDSPEHPSLQIDPKRSPHTYVLANAIHVYSHCWLVKTGTGYRFVYEPLSSIVLGLVSWVGAWVLPTNLICNLKPCKRYFRNLMGKVLEAHGMTRETMQYHELHFKRLCETLEAHLAAHPNHRYILLTSRPTLADVGLGTAFSSYFLMDDAPMEILTENYPLTLNYAARCACLSDDKLGLKKEETDEAVKKLDFPGDRDEIPSTLIPLLELMQEVLPWAVAQVEAFRRHMVRVEKGLAPGAASFIKLKSGPYAGKEAMPLRTHTSHFQYWMLVDQELMSCFVRASDLEIAVRAGKNVMQVWEAEQPEVEEQKLLPLEQKPHSRPQLRLASVEAVREEVDAEEKSKGIEETAPPATSSSDPHHQAVEESSVPQTTTDNAVAATDDATKCSVPAVAEDDGGDDDSELHPLATRDFSLYHQSTAASSLLLASWQNKKKQREATISMHDRIETILTLLARMHVPEYAVLAPNDTTRKKDFYVAMKPQDAADAEAKWRRRQ